MLKKLVLILLSAFLLTGCSSKNLDKNVVTFSSWGSITEVEVLKKIISDFEQENPNIKIQFLHIPQNYFQKLHLLFASSTAPDVVFINNLNLPIYEKYLEDLSEYIDEKKFHPVSIKSLTYQNKLLAIPRDVSSLVFYVNLDKTDLPKPDWTLNDLLTTSNTLKNKKTYALSFEDEIYWALPYLSYFTEPNLTNGISDEELEGIEFYKSLQEEYKFAPSKSQVGSSTLAQMFLDEKIVFYLSGRWMYPKIKEKADFNWGIINFPYGKGNQLIDSSGWAVTKKSKNKESAIKFVKYLSNKKSAKYFTQTGLVVSARIKASENLNNQEHNEKVFLEVLKHSNPTIVDKNYKKTVDRINKLYFE